MAGRYLSQVGDRAAVQVSVHRTQFVAGELNLVAAMAAVLAAAVEPVLILLLEQRYLVAAIQGWGNDFFGRSPKLRQIARRNLPLKQSDRRFGGRCRV